MWTVHQSIHFINMSETRKTEKKLKPKLDDEREPDVLIEEGPSAQQEGS